MNGKNAMEMKTSAHENHTPKTENTRRPWITPMIVEEEYKATETGYTGSGGTDMTIYSGNAS